MQGSSLQKVSDTALGIALCLHSHIHINSVLSDYVPKSVLGMPLQLLAPAGLTCHDWYGIQDLFGTDAGTTRLGALAVTGVSILGLTKLNLAGPGLTPTVKKLWTSSPPQ